MLSLRSVKDTQMSMESRGNDNERINPSYQEKNLCQCTSIYHKIPHWPAWFELRTARWEFGDKAPDSTTSILSSSVIYVYNMHSWHNIRHRVSHPSKITNNGEASYVSDRYCFPSEKHQSFNGAVTEIFTICSNDSVYCNCKMCHINAHKKRVICLI